MSESIIESLEVVEVEEENGDRLFLASSQLQSSFERLLQEASIERASQRVTNRLLTRGSRRCRLASERAICEAALYRQSPTTPQLQICAQGAAQYGCGRAIANRNSCGVDRVAE
jgi:hypothetical protein